jgi:hypothetical protein
MLLQLDAANQLTFKTSLMKFMTRLFPSPDLPSCNFHVTAGTSNSSVYRATTCGISKDANECNAV